MLWDSKGGWVLYLNREYNSSLKLLEPGAAEPQTLNPQPKTPLKAPKEKTEITRVQTSAACCMTSVLLPLSKSSNPMCTSENNWAILGFGLRVLDLALEVRV